MFVMKLEKTKQVRFKLPWFNMKQYMPTQEFSHKSRNVVSILLGNSFLELKCEYTVKKYKNKQQLNR